MNTFTHKLENAIYEMAKLANFQPTNRVPWIVIYKPNEEEDVVVAASEEQAIAEYIDSLRPGIEMDLNHDKDRLDPTNYRAEKPYPEAGEDVFSRKDIQIINLPKTKQTLEAWLNANPQGYTYHIIFGEIVKPQPGVITFCKIGNAGGDPLGPYMILHTLGHAVAQHCRRLSNSLSEELHLLAPDDGSIVHQYSRLVHTKAAQRTTDPDYTEGRGYPTFEELIYDLIGIYAKNGKIKIYPRLDPPTPVRLAFCNKVKQIIEKTCKAMLDDCVGKVITDN
jgi:hypothetical protein